MPVKDLFQALFQDRESFFEKHGITHVRATYLYFTPCDEDGQPVVIGDEQGNPIDGYLSAGGYQSAADAYEKPDLEPEPVFRETKTAGAGTRTGKSSFSP